MTRVRILSLIVLGLFLEGCSGAPGRPKPGPEVPRPDQVMDFSTLYRQNCAGCHGENGSNGPSYPLANPEYQALVDESVLGKIISQGEPGTLMPAFAISAGGTLTDAQVHVLVTGMRSSWWKSNALAGSNPPPYLSPAPGNAAQGLEAYSTHCAQCHGAADQAPGSVAGKAGSVRDPAFLALVSDQVLRTTIIAGRPDIGQPDWRNDLPGHPLTSQQVSDVVAWLSSQRSGATEQSNTPEKGTSKTGGGESR